MPISAAIAAPISPATNKAYNTWANSRLTEIKTTLARAKALRPYVEELITLAKKGDLTSRRQAAKFIYDKEIGKFIDVATGEVFETVEEGKKLPKQTVLRKLFCVIGKKYSDRNGGYTRIYHLPPRRGDASEMALIQLV